MTKLIKYIEIINNNKNEKVSKKELNDVALQNKLIHVGNRTDMNNGEYSEQAGFTVLNKTLIEPRTNLSANY